MNYSKAIGGSFAAIIALVIAQILSQAVARILLLVKLPVSICNIIAGILYGVLAFLLLKVLIEKLYRLKISDLGIPKFYIKAKWILVAVLLPVVIKGIYLLFIQGEFVSSEMSNVQIFETLSAGIFFTGIAAGFVEEMVFRGIIFHLIAKAWNIKAAILVPSVLFGVVHILGAGYSFGNCLLVVLAGTMVGIMFSLIMLESGSIWNSGIVHAVWNVVIIGGGLAIGEKADKYSVMTYVLKTKSFAITGGSFGIEASVVALIGYVAVSAIALVMIRNKKQ